MLKRLALVILLVGLCAVTGLAQAQERTVVWRSWDVRIYNVDTRANTFDVSESYDVEFTGTYSQGIASIPDTFVEDIRNIQVYENGRLLDRMCSEQRGTYCTAQSVGEILVTYQFSRPISNNSAKFRIDYTVIGAIRRYETGDLLGWTVVPGDHFGFNVLSSTVTIELPQGFGPREGIDPIETYGTPAEVHVQGTVLTAQTTQAVGTDGYFQIGAQFPHDPNGRVPNWQAEYDQQQAYEAQMAPLRSAIDLGVIGLSLLIALGGPLLIYIQWYTRGRDPKVGIVPEYLSEPPSDLRPAVVGTLVDERADLRDVLSTLIDLAQRGYLVIEENREEGFMGIGSSSKFIFKRTDQAATGLHDFESTLLQNLFPGNMLERRMESLQNQFYQYIPTLQNQLYQQLVKEGFYEQSPHTTRTLWTGIGGGILAIPIIIIALVLGNDGTLSGPSALALVALGFTGIVGLITAQFMPSKTQKGAEEAAKWRAFYRYMDNLDKYSSVEEASLRFEEYLPYAVAFGLNNEWIRRFSKLSDMPVPTWYFPTYMGGPYSGGYRPGSPLRRMGRYAGSPIDFGSGTGGAPSLDQMSSGMASGLQSMSNGLTNMLNSAGRMMNSRPQQSSSGRWRSGGRSFGGGGFRGGGFSGGGSRGFR
ncbi:MAG: DUF2207 domain-containing protein [Chloroflexi bacterium]|nr:DUF2207 domain-containing protein [Chloroflexota bacterium]